MTDRIVLRDLVFYGRHGSIPEEQHLGQRFVVDLGLELDLRPAGRADDLDLTVDYSQAVEVARGVVEGPPFRLTEAVAEQIAARLLDRFDRLTAVRVRVTKPSPPIPHPPTGSAAIEILRRRAGASTDA